MNTLVADNYFKEIISKNTVSLLKWIIWNYTHFALVVNYEFVYYVYILQEQDSARVERNK